MSLKAASLKHNEAQRRGIKKEVLNILANMDNEIKIAHEQGKNYEVCVSVPITFSIPHMQNKDAQRMIYYEILKSLMERDFIVEIELNKDSTLFYITWLSSEEKTEIELQNNMLAKHTRHLL
jgi:hypothetical protein